MHPGPVSLRVTDLDRSRDFYSSALGLTAGPEQDGRVRLTADGEHALVELDARDTAEGSPSPPRATGLFHLALLFPDRAELGRAVQRVLDAGVGLDGASDHLVSEAIYLHDPDGNGIEIYRDRPREQWPPPPPGWGVAMDTLPLDLAEVMAEAAPPDGGAPPGTVMGHVHLKVSDLERSVAFYRDALGLDVMAAARPPGRLPVGRRLPPPRRPQRLAQPGSGPRAARRGGTGVVRAGAPGRRGAGRRRLRPARGGRRGRGVRRRGRRAGSRRDRRSPARLSGPAAFSAAFPRRSANVSAHVQLIGAMRRSPRWANNRIHHRVRAGLRTRPFSFRGARRDRAGRRSTPASRATAGQSTAWRSVFSPERGIL